MFQNYPLTQTAIEQIEEKNKTCKRQDRLWKYDHILNGTEGCHLTVEQMQNPIGMEGLTRLLGMAETLRQERSA